ncbi:zinc finger protein 22-like [Candoia aspera]|uniref:zinc finger protein 22-like n=1 Tax=Candoia aspera TaxID=51853 RepID=UPI002FD8762F
MEEQRLVVPKEEEGTERGEGEPLVVQVRTVEDFLAGDGPSHIKPESEEESHQHWDSQWQEFLKRVAGRPAPPPPLEEDAKDFQDPLGRVKEGPQEESSGGARGEAVLQGDPNVGGKAHACLDCGKSFSERASLVKHKRTYTGEKPHKCSDCGGNFQEMASLIKHEGTHMGKKPYECSKCWKSFRTSSQLKAHKRTHAGEKPYQCLDCRQTFSQRSRLVFHARAHTGERPYGCPAYGKSFVSSSHLQKHKVVHTDGKLHKCSNREKAFVKNTTLWSIPERNCTNAQYVSKVSTAHLIFMGT